MTGLFLLSSLPKIFSLFDDSPVGLTFTKGAGLTVLTKGAGLTALIKGARLTVLMKGAVLTREKTEKVRISPLL